MKSIKESLGLARTSLSHEGLPKSISGILPNGDDELNNIWMEIMRAEESFGKLCSECSKFSSSINNLQSTEEKLVKSLGDSNIGIYCSSLLQAMDEYLTLIEETKPLVEDAVSCSQEMLVSGPEQYRLLYDHLNLLRKRRDQSITDIQKCQQKLDRLKLKGKRTTDLSVEKERILRSLREQHERLCEDVRVFHSSRVNLLFAFLRGATHNQVNLYGGVAAEYSKHLGGTGRPRAFAKDSEYTKELNSHLDKIRALTIVDR